MLLSWGTEAYFLLLVGFGLIGFLAALTMRDTDRTSSRGPIGTFSLLLFRMAIFQ